MPEQAGAPFRGNTAIRVSAGGGLTRRFSIVTAGVGGWPAGDRTPWEGASGSPITLTFNTSDDGIGSPPAPLVIRIEARVPGGAQIGTTDWTNLVDGETRTFHFDADPLNQSAADDDRWGAFELYIYVEHNDGGVDDYTVDSRGTVTELPAGWTLDWARGYLRAAATLSSHSISNVTIAGAEPSIFAYADPFHIRGVLAQTCVEAPAFTARIRDSGANVRSKAATSSAGVNQDASLTSATEVVDATFDTDSDDLRFEFTAADFGGDNKFIWATSGHESGWTRTSELLLDKAARVSVDPNVTLSNLAITTAGTTTSSIINRGEAIAGTVDIRNARNEAVAVRSGGTHRLRFYDVTDDAIETVHTTPTPSQTGATLTFSGFTFSTTSSTSAGNRATESLQRNPSDLGAAKQLRWDDSLANSPVANTSQVCRLSQSYEVRRHLQINQNSSIATADTESRTTRLMSDLGFIGFQVRNRRASGVSGVTFADGVVTIQDDASLVPALRNSGAKVTGATGYVPSTDLLAWDSVLPGGLWDFWISDGATGNGTITHNGNKAVHNRAATSSGDFTLLAVNPSVRVVAEGGPPTSARASHFSGSGQFQTFAGVVEGAEGFRALSTTSDPAVTSMQVTLLRLHSSGALQYLSTAMVWTDLVANSNLAEALHTVAESAAGSGLWTHIFSATADWDNYDVVVLARAVVNGTPYVSGGGKELSVATYNDHNVAPTVGRPIGLDPPRVVEAPEPEWVYADGEFVLLG